MFFRSGLFQEGRFLGKVLDEWIDDAQEFLHTKLPHLVVILILALIIGRVISLFTRHMILLAERRDNRPGRHSQIKTFAGVLRTTLIAILWTLTTLQALTVIGVNLGPLLASAGVAGIALGLAAQTIVKDVLNGTLIILEDQFNVGDTVRLTGMTGTVEVMTLRRTELRDNDGTLYIVPNSQITTVANLSRDFSNVTVNVSVDFSAAPGKVVPLLTQIAMDVRNDPAYAPLFLADPQVLGVDAIKGSEVVYPVVFRTEATKQYAPIREFRRRVRIALEEQGLLPGDPYRTFRQFAKPGDATHSSDSESGHTQQAAEEAARESATEPPIDATAIPAKTQDPFTAEA
jgi:small conductance mechanosensitive channel